MTKFCESCPNRGSIQGEITGGIWTSGRSAYSESVISDHTQYVYPYDAMVALDASGNISVPFILPPGVGTGELDNPQRITNLLMKIVDSCENPSIRKDGTIRVCGAVALRKLSLPPEVQGLVTRGFERAAISQKYNS